jgi:hypothetical protein
MLKDVWHWFFHDWGVWRTTLNQSYAGSYWVVNQTRTCKVCGKTQVRRVLS